MNMPDRNIGQYLTDEERERGCSVIYSQTFQSRWRTRDCVIKGEPCCPLGVVFPELGSPAPSADKVVSHIVNLGRMPGAGTRTLTICHEQILAFIIAVDEGRFHSADEIYAALGCKG